MKKIYSIIILMLFTTTITFAQDTLAGWTFPTGTSTDANPDYHITANAAMTITTQGGTSAIDFTKNGLTTKAAQTTGWDGGSNLKYWQIELNTAGYENLKLSSKQTAGGANPGPRDWKAQYKLGTSGSWTDIPNTTLINANNWTSAVLANVSIPTACDNQTSVFIRWLMTSDTSITPPALVLANGTTKIDDIFITGTVATTIVPEIFSDQNIQLFPNPCTSELFVNAGSLENKLSYEVVSPTGIIVKKGRIENIDQQRIFVGDLNSGYYFIRISTDKSTFVKKFIVM
jgi:hypothetical protein